MKLIGWACLGWLLVACSLPARGQVIRLAGGIGSLEAGEGAIAGMYEADRTSQVGLGFNRGLHASASREVHAGNAAMLVGDTTISLRLPTDLQDAARVLNVRGFMLRSEEAHSRTLAFLGTTGNVTGSAYFTSISSSRPVTVFSGARHEYATANAGDSPLWKGVTASRSTLLEGAVSVQLGPLQGTARGFVSGSGSQHTSGESVSAAWHGRYAETRVTRVSSATEISVMPDAPGPVRRTGTRAAFLESSQPLGSHIVVRESIDLGSGTISFEGGGTYEGERVSISAGHREVFLPFGSQSGFRRILVLALRLRLHDSQVGIDTISGGGLPAIYNISTDGYYGQMPQGQRTDAGERMPRLPRFAVRGRVLNEYKQPLRGAAVSVGTQTVYTGSDGRFLARMNRNAPVAVVLRPEEFLTPLHYKAISAPVTVLPEEEEKHTVELSAEVSKESFTATSPDTTANSDEDATSSWRKTGRCVKTLFHRMLSVRGVSRGEKNG